MKRCPECDKEMNHFEMLKNGHKHYGFWSCETCRIWEDERTENTPLDKERND